MGSPQFQPICPDRPLRLYDEPHGSEYFVIDELTSPPVWYRMNGLPLSPTAAPDTIRCPSEIRGLCQEQRPTERLYSRIAVNSPFCAIGPTGPGAPARRPPWSGLFAVTGLV